MAFALSENVDKGTNKTINDTTLVSFEQQAKKTGIDVTTNTKTSIQNDNHIIKNDKVNKIGTHRSNNPAIKEKEVTITFDSFLGEDMLLYNRSTQKFSYLESGGQIRYGLDDDEELYCQALYYDFGVETKSPTLIFCAVDSDGNITGYFNWCLYGADGWFVDQGYLDYDCFSVGGKMVPFSNSRSKLTPITDDEVFCYQTEESTKSLVCRFEGNGGTWDDILEYDVIQSPGDIFKLPSKDPYKNEDMHFDGYDYEGSKILENTEVPVNYGITAQTRWCNIVSYDYNGGEGPAETSVKKLENAKDFVFYDNTQVTKSGKKLLGWVDDNNKFYAPAAVYNLNKDISLTAVWATENNYSISTNPGVPLYVKVLVDGAFSSDAHLSTYNEIIQTLERSTDVPKYTFVKSSDNDLGNLTVSYSSCILDPTTSKLETHDFEVGFYGIKDTINITDGLMNGKELEASGDLEFDSNSTCNLVLNVENAIEDSVIFHGIAHEASSNGSGNPIYEADIIVFDEDGHKLSACKTGEDGSFEFAVAKKDIENKYIKTISCFAEGYVAQYQTYTPAEIEAATVISKNFDLKTGLKVDVDVKDIINFADFNVNVEKDSELISLQDIIKNDSFYFPADSQVTFDKTNKKATFSYNENAAIKVTLIADPQEGNDFNSWLYNNEIVGDETKTINVGDKISANFNHVVILKSADSKMGKVSNGSESQAQFVLSVNHGAELIVDNNKVIIGENEFTAIPEEGYEFVSWEEVDNSVTEATTYQANFKVTESPEPAPDPEKGSSADYSDTAQTGDISQYALVGLIIVVATIYVFARKKFFN